MKIRALTSIRGIAAWWVVAYHFREALPHWVPDAAMAFLSRGYLAVDLFFQLSGFVIALNYADRFQQVRLADIGRFLWLRLARIYPLHLFMLGLFLLNPLAVTLLSAHGDAGDRYNAGYFILSLFLVQNWGFTDQLAWNIPAWSISAEWFAYLLFPGLAWALLRWQRPGWVIAGLLISLAAFSEVSGVSLGAEIERFGALRCAIEFSIGVCLFLTARRISGTERKSRLTLALLGAMGCFGVYTFGGILDGAVIPLGFTLLVYSLSSDQSPIARVINHRALEFLGTVSYSTYLVHYFIKDWVKFLFVRPSVPVGLPFLLYIVLTALASVVLYKLVETPGREALRRFPAWLPWVRMTAER